MQDDQFKLLDPIGDDIHDKFQQLLEKGEFDGILQRLREAAEELPDSYSVSFDVQLNVYDADRDRSMQLLDTGMNTDKADQYRVSADTEPQKYLVHGQMCIVPEDYCPKCWGQWAFKLKNIQCPECGIRLGREIRLLIDDDVCPWCKEGSVSVDSPKCDNCDYEVDERMVAWG